MEFYSSHSNIGYWTECSAKKNFNIKETFRAFYKGNSIIFYFSVKIFTRNKKPKWKKKHSITLCCCNQNFQKKNAVKCTCYCR